MQDPEKAVGFILCQRRSRLIQHQDFRIFTQRPGNGYELLLTRIELTHRNIRVQMQIHHIHILYGVLSHLLPVNDTAFHRPAPQKDILRNGHVQVHTDFLVDHVNSDSLRLSRIMKVTLFSLNKNLSLITALRI